MSSPRPAYTTALSSETTNAKVESPSYEEESAPYNLLPHTPFSLSGFLLYCLLTPILGLGFVAFGFYIVYSSSPKSTENIAQISQGITVLFVLWHFIALAPALKVTDSVRNEEWWRRLVHGTTFNRVNSVSSNIGGNMSHTKEMLLAWKSRYYRVAWLAELVATLLADIGPSAIRVQSGLKTVNVDESFSVPALPKDSTYSTYTFPFSFTNNTEHFSIDLAPIYYTVGLQANTEFNAVPNALVPRPNLSSGKSYRYTTDV